jgi:hypothetical protein
MDVMALLRERKAKAASKVLRAEKALESAKKEQADVLAAERVMAELTGTAPESKSGDGTPSERDVTIAKLIPVEQSSALSPAELHPLYLAETNDSLNLDAFRTAVWRLQKKVIHGTEKSWIVKADNGKYWREPVVVSDGDLAEPPEEDDDDAPY